MSDLRKTKPQRRHFGLLAMQLGAIAMIVLEDGRRCSLLAHAGAYGFKPGQRIEVSLFERGDGALVAYDPCVA